MLKKASTLQISKNASPVDTFRQALQEVSYCITFPLQIKVAILSQQCMYVFVKGPNFVKNV